MISRTPSPLRQTGRANDCAKPLDLTTTKSIRNLKSRTCSLSYNSGSKSERRLRTSFKPIVNRHTYALRQLGHTINLANALQDTERTFAKTIDFRNGSMP
jgi:hypothetical protein